MKINYIAKEGVAPSSYWDMTFLKDLLSDIPQGDREVFLIPGAYQADYVGEINKKLSDYKKVMVFITSDEEGKFPCQELKHPDMILYCQYGTCQNPNIFPIGYSTDTRKYLKEIGYQKKTTRLFFAGQLNSDSRRKMFADWASVEGAFLVGTNGFAKGIPRKDYFENLARALYAPAPPGHVSFDSFRFYEALEAGCKLIDFPSQCVDTFFPDLSWWIKKKFDIKQKLREELETFQEMVTVIVPTSPIPSHPSTEIIDQTIKSIREQLDAPIYILIDGVREEQKEMFNDYTEYIRRLLWKCNFEYENVVPILHDEHKHQSGMVKGILPEIKSPLLLFVEHDTPLTGDIPWNKLSKTLLEGKSSLIRFHYEEFIPEPHKYLMVGEVEDDLQKTIQFSARPHLARTDYYRFFMDKYFLPDSNGMIEDRMHGWVQAEGWDLHKLHIYHPKGSIRRSLNLDGREGNSKYEETFKY